MVNQELHEEPSVSVGTVVAWTSVLLGFGSIQGVIYLRAYWGRFRLDPFQYSEASSLALAGLTGIGVTVALMGVASLVGGCVSDKLDELRSKHRVVGMVVAAMLLVVLAVLTFLVDWGVYLVAGMLLTWFMIFLAYRSPLTNVAILRSKWLPYISLAVAYVPLASHYYGHRQADTVMNSEIYVRLDAPGYDGEANQGVRFAGRLGDGYVLYRPRDGAVLIVPAASIRTLTLAKTEASPAMQQARGATAPRGDQETEAEVSRKRSLDQ